VWNALRGKIAPQQFSRRARKGQPLNREVEVEIVDALLQSITIAALSMRAAYASYGIDQADQYRRAAGYISRILNGEKPAELPVQQATKFELALNLKPGRLSASKFRRRCSPAPTR
jgi:ABC transporter substrate binding protein